MLTLNQGNTYTIAYSILNTDGSNMDLSGTSELKYSMSKKKQNAPVISYELTDSVLSFTGNTVSIQLESSVLNPLAEGAYYHELWHVNASGDPLTLMSGNLAISSKLIKE